MAEGKTSWGTLRGYYEADWLGTGITSNNNQSNSYVLRQRVIWAQAETNNHWAFTGGQLWSLATEDKKGISNFSGDIMTPQTIDPNYVAGFVWTRQYGFRVTKTFNYAAFGIAAENPQLLYTASLAGNTPYAVLGSAGTNGGNYNAAISACSPVDLDRQLHQPDSDRFGRRHHRRRGAGLQDASTAAPTSPHSPSTRRRTSSLRPPSIRAGATMKSSASAASRTRRSIPAKPPTATSMAA